VALETEHFDSGLGVHAAFEIAGDREEIVGTMFGFVMEMHLSVGKQLGHDVPEHVLVRPKGASTKYLYKHATGICPEDLWLHLC
jgi:hypothetical protein